MAEQTFPWIFYHPTEPSRIFESQEELRAAGPGWVLSPEAAAHPSAPAPEPTPSEEEPPPRRTHR